MRYANGEDVKQDYSQAMRWFLLAADQGNVHAQGRVATWMLAGRGSERRITAKRTIGRCWRRRAATNAGRTIVVNSAPYLSPVQTAAEQKRAEDWLHAHHIGQASE